tara:strand:+ start:26 stop:310 length:285 start_codon:yes stop_codon:yes gene_type:complete
MLRIIKRLDEYGVQNSKLESERVKCLVCDISDADKREFEIELTLVEYELIKMLNNIQSAANLYPPIMNELYDKIQKYANTKYQQALSENKEDEQ